jgi:hypothetical protein
VAVNWWYDSFNPGAVFALGPRHDSLKDTVWAEVRLQRQRALVPLPDHFIGPSAPEMRSSPDHWAKGLTAAKDASLTGRHLPRMLFVIEEACGVDPIFWRVVQTMFDPSLGHAQLCIFNPTDTTSQAYLEDQKETDGPGERRWHRFVLSALNHPNVLAELRGEEPPIRGAVSLKMIEQEWIPDWCEPIRPEDRLPTDVEWPPSHVTGKPGNWYRPGPEFEARALGRWPSQGSGVWSDAIWEKCFQGGSPSYPLDTLPQIGCDCATGRGKISTASTPAGAHAPSTTRPATR